MGKICEQCGGGFEINERLKSERIKRFCGNTCARKNMGLKNRGRTHSVEVNNRKGLKGKLNYFYDKKWSVKEQEEINESRLSTNISNVKKCCLSELECEVLDGIMISDGCLTSKSAISARISLGFKYGKTLEDIKEVLPSITFSDTNVTKNGKSFHNKSRMYGDLLAENKRWYTGGVKVVPDDFRLTKVACYWWFIGDGYTTGGNVYLCTDSFTKDENLSLTDKFKEVGFTCKVTANNRIRFYKKDSLAFLKWILPKDGVHEQYKYKWI